MSDKKTKEFNAKYLAILDQIGYLIGEGWEVPFIFVYEIPGSKPGIIMQGNPKSIMRLSAKSDMEVDKYFGKITYVEMISEGYVDEHDAPTPPPFPKKEKK